MQQETTRESNWENRVQCIFAKPLFSVWAIKRTPQEAETEAVRQSVN